MATITLNYDARNPVLKRTLDYIFSLGFSEVKTPKSTLQMAFNEVESGKLTTLYTPKKTQIK